MSMKNIHAHLDVEYQNEIECKTNIIDARNNLEARWIVIWSGME